MLEQVCPIVYKVYPVNYMQINVSGVFHTDDGQRLTKRTIFLFVGLKINVSMKLFLSMQVHCTYLAAVLKLAY